MKNTDDETPIVPPSGAPSKRVQFHYLKSPHFRAVHVDGAIGGLSPRGFLHVAIYSERPALPRLVEYEVEDDGTLSSTPVAKEGREGIVREMEVDLVMDLAAAVALHDWLGKRLQAAVKLSSEEAPEEEGAR